MITKYSKTNSKQFLSMAMFYLLEMHWFLHNPRNQGKFSHWGFLDGLLIKLLLVSGFGYIFADENYFKQCQF
jgi:hypothetical protein